MKRRNLLQLISLTWLSACAQAGPPLVERWPYLAANAPVIKSGQDTITESQALSVALDYVRQTRHWQDQDFKIYNRGYVSRVQGYLFEVIYLPDEAKMPVPYPGGWPNSFGIVVDGRTGLFSRELHFQ